MNYYYLHKNTKGLKHKPNEIVNSSKHMFYNVDYIEKLWAYEDNDKIKLQTIFNEAQELEAQKGDLWQMRCIHNLKGAVTDYEFELEKQITDLSKQLDAKYNLGIIKGMSAFAWWKDNIQYVGTCGTKLEDAIKEFKG